MLSTKQVSLFTLFVLICFTSQAQLLMDTTNSYKQEFKLDPLKVNPASLKNNDRFRTRSLFIPGFMIAYGLASMEVEGLESLNDEIKDEIYAEEPHRKSSIDNYLQFAPGLAVYGLNAMGIKGKHNFRDWSILYLMSSIIVTTSVYSIKKISHQQRPDGSTFNSFPSGHTAMAFASAEFLRQEYKDVSSWYGYAGYAVAATTGYLRMYNNKHWLSDIVAGAGIGIISTKIAYWLYPKIKHAFFKGKNTNTFVMPSYSNKTFGFAMVHHF
jgi:PAP2 superfamily